MLAGLFFAEERDDHAPSMTASHNSPETAAKSQIDALRVLDAAANRATEGLRVMEDFARFGLDDAHLTRLVKTLRHDLAAACAALPWPDRLAARDTQRDVGTDVTTPAEGERTDAWAVCSASVERAKQSLRSLEEFGKLAAPESTPQFQSLRYRLYTLEKAMGITHDSIQRLADVRLCVLVDGRATIDEFRRLVAPVIAAGVGMIQLREKGRADAELAERARLRVRLLRQLSQDAPVLAIINDRADIAAAVDADGVHVGQEDMSVKDARAILGPRKLIGVSTHNIEQARAAVLDGANYLGVGPTFRSATKQFDAFPGLAYLSQVAAEIRLPTFAIGGIGPDNLSQVLETGIRHVAVSSAVTAAAEPGGVVAKLTELLLCATDTPPAPAGG
jgi:thiamine-phosphate pyrophosphorylase